MNIIIFYQHKVRELEACRVLTKRLVSKSEVNKVEIFQIDFQWDLACSWAKKNGLDVVVMPWLYMQKNYVLLHPFLKQNPKLVIINLHHEQISNQAYEKLLLPKGEHCKNGTYHFVWGSFFKEKLIENGVKPDLIYETGNIRLDVLKDEKKHLSKQEVAPKYQLDPSKKWILYAENRGWVYKVTQAFIDEYINNGISLDDLKRNRKVCTQSLELTYKEFDELPDNFFDEFELIYRPHPGTTSPITSGKVKVISERSIGDWLECIDCLLVWDSTSAYEAEVANVPVFRHEPIEHPSDLLIYGMEKIPVISSIVEVSEILGKGYHVSNQKIYEKYYGKVDGCSTERAADAIVACSKNDALLNSFFKLSKKEQYFLLRITIFNKISRLAKEMKILEKFHWPRSAYNHKNDIP